MAQKLLDRAQDSGHDKTAGKGVPKAMPGEISNPGHANGGLEPMTTGTIEMRYFGSDYSLHGETADVTHVDYTCAVALTRVSCTEGTGVYYQLRLDNGLTTSLGSRNKRATRTEDTAATAVRTECTTIGQPAHATLLLAISPHRCDNTKKSRHAVSDQAVSCQLQYPFRQYSQVTSGAATATDWEFTAGGYHFRKKEGSDKSPGWMALSH
jgi:hypothetical protein